MQYKKVTKECNKGECWNELLSAMNAVGENIGCNCAAINNTNILWEI